MGMIDSGATSSNYELKSYNGKLLDENRTETSTSSETTSDTTTDDTSSSTSDSEDSNTSTESLSNKRGKEGTITTSWSGFLSKNSDQPKRKKLLGE